PRLSRAKAPTVGVVLLAEAQIDEVADSQPLSRKGVVEEGGLEEGAGGPVMVPRPGPRLRLLQAQRRVPRFEPSEPALVERGGERLLLLLRQGQLLPVPVRIGLEQRRQMRLPPAVEQVDDSVLNKGFDLPSGADMARGCRLGRRFVHSLPPLYVP